MHQRNPTNIIINTRNPAYIAQNNTPGYNYLTNRDLTTSTKGPKNRPSKTGQAYSPTIHRLITESQGSKK